ncbi:hypothetical protein AB0K35_04510 [Micromonospora sp. NPDC053740]|uniref:hypothetical protein n=1 Tax=Micromonospora sp. NPDC053740 TaxID=3155173 RepID=UPI0034160B27
MRFEEGQKLRIPDKRLPEWVTVMNALPLAGGVRLFVLDANGRLLPQPVDLTDAEAARVLALTQDGGGDSARVLAGMWTLWMPKISSTLFTAILITGARELGPTRIFSAGS